MRFVKAPGLKNEGTLLEQFPLVTKSDGIDLNMLAGLLSVEQDLLTDFVFEIGFDVTATQVVAAIDVMNRAMKSPEASTVVSLTDAATDAAMPVLHSATGSAEAAVVSAKSDAITASSSGAGDLQQAAVSIVVGEAEASSCK